MAERRAIPVRLRELQKRLPTGVQLRTRRLWNALIPILQCSIAAALAWWVASEWIGHIDPFFAPIAAVISLGLGLGQRLRRSMELMVGVSIGIGVADLLVSLIGRGPWQLAVVVALAMAAAVLADPGPLTPMQAASSAVLVVALVPVHTGPETQIGPLTFGPGGIVPDRMVDAVIGGIVGLMVVAVIPTHPALRARNDAAAILDTMRRVVIGIATGLADGNLAPLELALDRARDTQPAIDKLRGNLAGGHEIAQVSPVYWHSRGRMAALEAIADPLDLAVRNVRVLSRRALSSAQHGETVPEALVAEIRGLAEAFSVLRDMVLADPGEAPDQADAARVLRSRARRIQPELIVDADLSSTVMYAQIRSILVDLLMVAGLKRTSAIATLPHP